MYQLSSPQPQLRRCLLKIYWRLHFTFSDNDKIRKISSNGTNINFDLYADVKFFKPSIIYLAVSPCLNPLTFHICLVIKSIDRISRKNAVNNSVQFSTSWSIPFMNQVENSRSQELNFKISGWCIMLINVNVVAIGTIVSGIVKPTSWQLITHTVFDAL